MLDNSRSRWRRPLRRLTTAILLLTATAWAHPARGIVIDKKGRVCFLGPGFRLCRIELDGKLTGISLRVPVPAGSIIDLVVALRDDPSIKEVNSAMKTAADGPLAGILEYTTDPIVSSDVIGSSYSCIFDSSWTTKIGQRMVKVLGWYDNEYGYSSRTADLIAKVAAFE